MFFHCNTTSDETIAYLRDQAIRAKVTPQTIDALDALRDLLELSTEMEKLEQQVTDLEHDCDDLRGELTECAESLQIAVDIIALIDKDRASPALFYDAADLRTLQHQLVLTAAALERHKT